MNAEVHLPRGEKIYEHMLEGLVRVNEQLYRDRHLPSIYTSGVRYRREPTEVWRNAEEVLSGGWGDCEDLAAARAGELRAKGESRAKVVVRRTGPKMTHALVQRGSGKIEDPSKRLGMNSSAPRSDSAMYSEEYDEYEDGGTDESEEIGADVSQSCEVTWAVNRTPTGWKGTVRVPMNAGRCLLVSRTAASKKAATSKALSAASQVLDSPLAQALIPPQAQAALKLIQSPQAQKAAKIALSAAKKLKFW